MSLGPGDQINQLHLLLKKAADLEGSLRTVSDSCLGHLSSPLLHLAPGTWHLARLKLPEAHGLQLEEGQSGQGGAPRHELQVILIVLQWVLSFSRWCRTI